MIYFGNISKYYGRTEVRSYNHAISIVLTVCPEMLDPINASCFWLTENYYFPEVCQLCQCVCFGWLCCSSSAGVCLHGGGGGSSCGCGSNFALSNDVSAVSLFLFSLALFDQWRQCVSLWWRVSAVLSNLIMLCIRYSRDHIICGHACVHHWGGCGNICISF